MDLKEKLERMSLEELSEVTKVALSLIYSKLRNEKGFDYDQHCSVVSFGGESYDVELVVTDGTRYDGENYISTYWI